MEDKVNLREALAGFEGHWEPRIVAMLNDYKVLVVKVEDEFVWHSHADTDDLFLVLKGRLTIQLRDRDVDTYVSHSSLSTANDGAGTDTFVANSGKTASNTAPPTFSK